MVAIKLESLARIAAIALSLSPTLGCRDRFSRLTASPACKSLERFDVTSASRDAIQALKIGNTALIQVFGYVSYVPGVTEKQIVGHKLTDISGTTDAPESEYCEILNERAVQYATKYNQTVIALETSQRLQK